MMRRAARFFALFAATWGIGLIGSVRVQAEVVYVAPAETTGGDRDIDSATREAVREALLQVLGTAGHRPVRGEAPEEPCDAECLQAAAERAGASLAVTFRLWRQPGAIDSFSMDLVVVDQDAATFEATADLSQDREATLTALFAEALERRDLGPGPWLFVSGSPAGASFQLDTGEEGTVPQRIRVPAGFREVTVTAPGYARGTYPVRVPDQGSAEVELSVALQSEGSLPTTGPGALSWLSLAGGLAGGAGLLATGVVGFALGTEDRLSAGGLLEREGPNELAAGLYLGGGAALVGLGVFLFFALDDDTSE